MLGVAGVVAAAAAWFGATGGAGGGGGGDRTVQVRAAASALLSIPDGATGISPTAPLTVRAPAGEQVGAVTLVDSAEADTVSGTFGAGRGSWTNSEPLRGGATYTLTAITTDHDGATGLATESFTTAMPDDPLQINLVTPQQGEQVGVGQPIVVSFSHAVADKAAMQTALRVSSSPPQPGTWSWLSDTRVDYRPQQYWKPGTVIKVRLGLDGLDDGSGRFGTADKTFSFTVGRDQETTVDLHSHELTVRRDGQVVRTFPITGGMPGLDTWDGTYAVIDKASTVDMNSETVGLGDAYNVTVNWAVHLTYTGTYVHAAPWSVYAQGSENVSHGCVGASTDNAEWFFDNTLPGDIVQVVNSPRTAAVGNGFNDWQDSWSQWQAGSAVTAT